jgi:surface antigen
MKTDQALRPTRLFSTAGTASLAGAALALLASCGGAELGDPEPVNPTAFSETAMPACGTALASFDGDTAHSNGSYTGTGTSCAGTGTYGYQYQCVELVMRHFTRKWGLHWYGNAKDLLNNAPRASVDVYKNGDHAHPPKPGDMLVWTNGTYGHVALITAVRSNAVDIIEQNVAGNGKATLGYNGSSIAARWTNWVPAGWAHAKANPAK